MVQDEELISNISYTSSDFRSIFPQLLDTAKKLTNKWDPSLSNESDPGNILLKEAAIVGDKNNYHIDKNVLECFPLSATQQSSARQLYDLAGYNMHWYNSAYSTAQFTLLKSLSSIESENSDAQLSLSNIILYPGTQISDSTGEYVYSILNKVTLTTAKELQSVKAIQGTIEQYEINGDYAITIDNLDENLRIYFPQNYIAENGIFVYDKDSIVENIGYHNDYTGDNTINYWGKVDNLTQYPAKSKIFKFGLDLDSDKCYIEFPEEIISIIGNGLNIYYTTTKGHDGNVKSGILNTFVNDIIATGDNDSVTLNKYIRISNIASIGGKDPESLQSAYKNYKKTIGTYSTLVSRRDYNNAIYNLKENDETGISLVSNSIVADRTSDMNNSQPVMVSNGGKNYLKNFVLEDSSNKPTLKSYDIILYLLRQPGSMNTTEDYNKSFTPDLSAGTLSNIEYDLDSYKSVQHNLQYINNIYTASNPPYFDITNVIALNGTITTYYKVTKKEAEQIENNVTKAIIENYNSRELEFGQEIDYDKLTQVIKAADDRIKSIILDLPNYEPHIQLASDSTPASLYKNNTLRDSINNQTLAKMILSGKVQLFNFLDDFQVDFGQTNATQINDISSISVTNNITLTANTEYKLNPNDIIQIVTPDFQVTETYSATVKYSYRGAIVNSGDIYVLTKTDRLDVTYALENGELFTKTLDDGTIIRPQGFQLKPTSTSQTIGINEGRLLSGQSLEILQISKGIIDGTSDNIYYYIVTNNVEKTGDTQYYKLALTANEEYILQQDEYFIYTSDNLNGFIALGSGTSLICDSAITFKSKVLELDEVYNTSYEDIYNQDITTAWNKLTVALTRTDNNVITLTENDYIKSTIAEPLTGTLGRPLGILSYKFADDSTYTEVSPIANLSDYTIKARSTMLLQTNSIKAQVLNGNQTITVNGKHYSIEPKSGKYYSILSSYPVNLLGGENLNVKILNETTGQYEALLDLLFFVQGTVITDDDGTNDGTITNTFTIDSTMESGNDYIIPLKYPVGDIKEVKKGNIVLTYQVDPAKNTIKISTSDIAVGNTLAITFNIVRHNDIVLADNATLNFTFNNLKALNDITDDTDVIYYLIPIEGHITSAEGVTGFITITTNNGSADRPVASIYNLLGIVNNYNPYSQQVTGETLVIKDILAVSVANGSSTSGLKITFKNCSDQQLYIGNITRVHNINSEEINMQKVANNTYYSYDISNSTTYAAVVNSLKSLPGAKQFDFTYRVPDVNKVLQPLAGESYFNINHIYNEYTISKIDVDNNNIKVASSNII